MFLQILVTYFFVVNVHGQQCHQDWLLHEESCYGFGEYRVTWGDAQVMCMSFDSKLAEIETSDENEYLKNMATTKGGDYYWVGATDIFHEGLWEWVSTRKNVVDLFTDWMPGGPTDDLGGQDCLCLDHNHGFQWDDCRCEQIHYFICEAKPLEEPVVG